MKFFKMLTFTFAAALAVSAFAQAPDAKLAKYRGWGADRLSFNTQSQLVCNKNYYYLNFLQNKPNKQGLTHTFINLSAPRENLNFGRAPINFLNITVNGVQLNRIEPQLKNVVTWRQHNAAGSEITLNFDGAKIIMNAHVKNNSPLLFLTFKQPAKQIEPIKGRVTISLTAVVSQLLSKNGIGIFTNAYNRQALTATRSLKQQKQPFPLTAQDKYLVLSDSVFDGSGKGKGVGPCLIVFELKDGITGKLHMGNNWTTRAEFSLPANFKEFKCALFMQKNVVSNDVFMKHFNAEKAAFTKLN